MMKRFGLVLFGFALCTAVLQRSPLLWAGYLKFDKKWRPVRVKAGNVLKNLRKPAIGSQANASRAVLAKPP